MPAPVAFQPRAILGGVESFFEAVNESFRSEALPALIEYVSIKSLSPAFDPNWEANGEIERALAHIAAWAESRPIPGIEVRASRIEGITPALVVEIPAAHGGSGTVLMYGHMDKQPATAPWANGTHPFEAVVADDSVFGRGAADDGYALFAALTGLGEIISRGLPSPRCVVVIEASEESGSPDLDAHVEALAPELGDVGLVVCLDSGGLDFERLWVTTSLRGNLVLTLDVEVLAHGVHSGSAGGVVPSSFRILRSLLDRVEDAATGEILPRFLNADIPEFHRERAAALDEELKDPLSRAFPAVGGMELMGAAGAERILAQTWRPSLAFTGIEGVPDIASGGNVLRPRTKAKISLRLPPTVDAAVAQEKLVQLLASDAPYGAKVVVEAEAPAQGWVAPDPRAWLAEALDAASRDGFGRPAGYCGEGGSIPFLATLGTRFPDAQFVATGVLGPGSNAHGPDEALRIPAAVGVSVAVAHLAATAARMLR